jgi:hypothetical protein
VDWNGVGIKRAPMLFLKIQKRLKSHYALVSGQIQFSKKSKTNLLSLKVSGKTKTPALLPGF